MILRKFVFIFVIISISYYSFHEFAFKTIFDSECKTIVEQSTKISNFDNENSEKCSSHSLCISEHELHKYFLNIEKYFQPTIIANCNFYTYPENYSIKVQNVQLKPPSY